MIKDVLIEDVFLEAILSPIEGVPGVNSLSSFAKYGFADALVPSPVSTLTKTGKDVMTIEGAIVDGEYGKGAKAAGRVGARLTGVPFDAGMKSLERIGDFIGVKMPWQDGKKRKR